MSVGGGGERVEEGIDLARLKLIQTATQARMNMKPDVEARFHPRLRFGNGSPAVNGMPLLPTLSEVFAHVERALGTFNRRFL